MAKKLRLGLDLGIASVGWALMEADEEGQPTKIKDRGVLVFDQIEDPKSGKTANIKRREKRSLRRQRRRTSRRLEDGRSLFKKEFGLEFEEVVKEYDSRDWKGQGRPSPVELKVKGLTEELSKEELMLALYHYLKYRGYKSNRKKVKNKSEDGKMLGNIETLKREIAERAETTGEVVHVSTLLLEKWKQGDHKRYHNTDDEYNLTVERYLYEEEISALLDTQISYGVVSSSFKEEFLKLFSRQRDYSEGPDPSSPYVVDFNRDRGVCLLDNQKRAPKDSYAANKFVAVSALANLRYTVEGEEGAKVLTNKEKEKGLAICLSKKETTFEDLFKKLGINPTSIKNLPPLSKSKIKKISASIHEDYGDDEEYFVNGVGTEKQKELFRQKIKEAELKQAFFKCSDFLIEAKKKAKKDKPQLTKEEEMRLSDCTLFDEMSEILFVAKTDAKIEEECKKRNFSEGLTEFTKCLEGVSKTINLSIDAANKVADYLLAHEGEVYSDALDALYPGHRDDIQVPKVLDPKCNLPIIPEIDKALEGINVTLLNPVVKHSLVNMRKVVNALIRKYGQIDYFAIEFGRELRHNFKDRRAIQSEQIENMEENLSAKMKILEMYPGLASLSAISKGSLLLKQRLFKEQGGIDPYSMEQINENLLFSTEGETMYEIDHILPFSRSFDDSFSNKVLVRKEMNQNKKNRTPYEVGGKLFENVLKFVETNKDISPKKRENLLNKTNLESLDFLNKDLNDDRYLARLARNLIKAYILPAEGKILTPSGKITEVERRKWGLSGKTHSYISSSEHDYKARFLSDYKYERVVPHEDNNNRSYEFVFVTKKYKGKTEEKAFEVRGPVKKDKDNEVTTDFDEAFNYFFSRGDALRLRLSDHKGESISKLIESFTYRNINEMIMAENLYIKQLLENVLAQIQQQLNQKDRDNHLHHVIDAIVIACTTMGNVQKITRSYQKYELGERDDFELDLPYESFTKEASALVYERDLDKLLEILNALPNYKEDKADKYNTRILLPARQPEKVKIGALTKEMIYGPRSNPKDPSGLVAVKRVSVLKIKPGDADKINIYDADGGNKAVADAVKEWVRKTSKPTTYPMLPGNPPRPIKKVQIVYPLESMVELKAGRFAENESFLRVDIYKKKGDNDTLYFSPVSSMDLVKKANPNYERIMYWKRDDGIKVSNREIKEKYEVVARLPRKSLIEIEKTDGSVILAYSGGVTKGKFEIYSILGDNVDLGLSGVGAISSEQIRLSVSTIKSIKVRSISVLGELS